VKTPRYVEAFYTFREYSGEHITVYVNDGSFEEWYGRTSFLYILSSPIAKLVKLSRTYIVTLDDVSSEDKIRVVNTVLGNARRYLGVDLPVRVRRVTGERIGSLVFDSYVVETPGDLYVFVWTPSYLPVYISGSGGTTAVVMARAARAALLSDDDIALIRELDELFGEYGVLTEDANKWILDREAKRQVDKLYEEVANSVISAREVFNRTLEPRYRGVLMLRGDETRETVMTKVREAVDTMRDVVSRLRELITYYRLTA
jgi:hypothetical protein